MERYAIRVAKYVVYLIVLFLIIFTVMNSFNGTNVGLSEILHSSRSIWLLLVVVVFALLYPFFGFSKKSITFDASTRVEETQKVMNMCGYIRTGGTQQCMEFRATTSMKRLLLMYEDMIKITTIDGISVMEGPRKEVVKASFRMTTFVS